MLLICHLGASCSSSQSPIMDVEDMSKSSVERPPVPAVHLFKSLKDAHGVLRADRASGALPESEELKALFERVERSLRRLEGGGDGLAVASDTFVVSVEGLDGSGKSSLVRGLGGSSVALNLFGPFLGPFYFWALFSVPFLKLLSVILPSPSSSSKWTFGPAFFRSLF